LGEGGGEGVLPSRILSLSLSPTDANDATATGLALPSEKGGGVGPPWRVGVWGKGGGRQ
jgi:hypothetical protein